jgi:hypothetical protein
MPKLAPWRWVNSASNFSFREPATGVFYRGAPALTQAIKTRYFRVITLSTIDLGYGSGKIVASAIQRYDDYRLVRTVTVPPWDTTYDIYLVERG